MAPDWITAAATSITAVFVLGALVIAFRSHRLDRSEVGANSPIRVHAALGGAALSPDWEEMHEWTQDAHLAVVDLHMYNRSGFEQVLSLPSIIGIRILWPRVRSLARRPYFFGSGDITFKPHEGGNIVLRLVVNDQYAWDDILGGKEEANANYYKRHCFIYLRGHTASGHVIRYLGRLKAREYRGKDTGWH